MVEDERNPLDGIFIKPEQEHEAKNYEDIKIIIKEWLNKKHIYAKTRLTKNQVIAVTILKSLADKYQITPLKKFLQNYQTYKLSEDGKSSEELIDILRDREMTEDGGNMLQNISKFLES